MRTILTTAIARCSVPFHKKCLCHAILESFSMQETRYCCLAVSRWRRCLSFSIIGLQAMNNATRCLGSFQTRKSTPPAAPYRMYRCARTMIMVARRRTTEIQSLCILDGSQFYGVFPRCFCSSFYLFFASPSNCNSCCYVQLSCLAKPLL